MRSEVYDESPLTSSPACDHPPVSPRAGKRARRGGGGSSPGPTRGRQAPSLGWVVALVLGFALAARIYYFLLTRDQPVWWDEAEYLLAARSVVLDTPTTGFFAGRPMLLSWILSASFAVGAGEVGARVFMVLVSFAGVVLCYRIGKELFGQVSGLVAALLLSTVYVHIFYSNRILTEIPHVTACLLGMDLLLSGRPRRVLLAVPLLVVGALTRFPAALLGVVVLAYAVLVERGKLARSRPFLGSVALGVLCGMPYLAWAWATHGDPLFAYKASSFHMPSLGLGDGLEGLRYYLALVYQTMGPVIGAVLVVGVVRSLRFVLTPRRVLLEGDRELAAGLLLFLWMATPVLYFSFFLRPLDDRFTILALPPALIVTGEATVWLAGLIARGRPRLAAAVALLAGAAAALFLLGPADRLIRYKVGTYGSTRDAGLWIKAHSKPGARIMTSAAPQITYYAERATAPIPADPVAFASALRAEERPQYVVLSRHEGIADWLTFRATLKAVGLRLAASFPEGSQAPEVFVLAVPQGPARATGRGRRF
jgi:4-amino-4-deoxy-L-arabinose transferase-like glycosyltransferase